MATKKLGLELELVGSADGAPVEIIGTGSLDPGAGRLALEVRVSRSLLLLDPGLVVLGLLDVLALAAGLPDAMGDGQTAYVAPYSDAHAHVRMRTDLYDEHGREAGGWRVVAGLAQLARGGRGRTGGGVRLDGQFLDHVARIEPGERVAAVDAPWGALVQRLEPEGVLLASAWEARTGRGNGYRGVTTTAVEGWGWPAAWDGSGVLRVAIDDFQIRRTEAGSAGETVAIDARIATDRLARSPQ